MFEKGVCEEIVDKNNIKIIFSNYITDAYINACKNKKEINIPKYYLDKASNNKNRFNIKYNLRYIIHRLHDCSKNQTFYIISLFSPNIKDYDKDFIQFIMDAAKYPKYQYDVFFTTKVFTKKFKDVNEVIFTIDLDELAVNNCFMNRNYRIELDLLDKVSLLADYREELNTIDQEG